MDKLKSKTGTREWSDVSHNVGIGCSHGCLYCYSAEFYIRKGIVKDRADSMVERLTSRKIPTKDGVIMFPSAHDITPFYLRSAFVAIEDMMQAGRQVVIVTKAHLDCIKELCDMFTAYRDKLLIRITIGSMDEKVCKFWEPGAPAPSERLSALKHAFTEGYRTSVSMEPILLGVSDAVKTFYQVEPFVNEKIWIGKMNSPDIRVDKSVSENRSMVAYIKKCQSDDEIKKLYQKLKDHPKVEWKDSIKQIVGL
jgi:DNA repair photolyase